MILSKLFADEDVTVARCTANCIGILAFLVFVNMFVDLVNLLIHTQQWTIVDQLCNKNKTKMASKNLRELRMSTAMSSLTLNRTRSTLAPSLSENTRVKKVCQMTRLRKVNSVQEACDKCFVVHILEFEILQITWKKMKQRTSDP